MVVLSGEQARVGAPASPPNNPAGAAVEQREQGTRPAAELVASFDGLGVGFDGPQGISPGRNPSDNSLAVGPDHIMQTDKFGSIGIGYSFGGTPHFAGQRFDGRLASDPPGVLSLRESVLVEGEAAQTSTNRWEDYSQTAVDPDDDCTIWYVGDYYKKDATNYSTRIGAFRMGGCGG